LIIICDLFFGIFQNTIQPLQKVVIGTTIG